MDLQARSCVTQIDVTGPGDGDTFSEQHRQFFFRAADVRRALADAGFGSPSVTDEYTDETRHAVDPARHLDLPAR